MKIERTFKEVEVIRKKNSSEDLQHLVTVYDGDTAGLKSMTTKYSVDSMSWNKELIQPMIGGETVYEHPDQAGIDPAYVRVIHSDRKVVAIFLRKHFETII